MSRRPPTRLPQYLAALYGLMIVYASLEPFSGWMPPLPGTPFFAFAPWPRVVRFDVAINVIAYAPFGLLLALIGRRRPAVRLTTAIGVGTLLSFAMESAQTFLPTRDASSVDLISNSLGTTVGAVAALAFNRAPRLRERVAQWRYRVFLEGRVGDFGLALLGVWLISQINPGIPLFAATFDPSLELTRTLLLRSAAWESWLKPGVSAGVAAGALILMLTIWLPRPVRTALCAIALLSSLVAPLLAPDMWQARAPLALFDWPYGQLLNFNGLTHAVLVIWPVLASTYLLWLAGQPGWGQRGGTSDSGDHV